MLNAVYTLDEGDVVVIVGAMISAQQNRRRRDKCQTRSTSIEREGRLDQRDVANVRREVVGPAVEKDERMKG